VVISPAVFRRLCRARAILEAEGDLAWTIAGVARKVGLSPFHLIRCFRALFGVTPHQFRTNARQSDPDLPAQLIDSASRPRR
jgi:AraC-like DNA-binding protein